MNLEIAATILLSFATLLGGLICLIRFVWSVIFVIIVNSKWKSTEGVVLSYAVVPVDNEGAWKKQMEYQYIVDSKTYTGTNILNNLYWAFASNKLPDKHNDDYHTGQHIEVRYNPKNPEKAIVEYKFDAMNVIWLIFGIICFSGTYISWPL